MQVQWQPTWTWTIVGPVTMTLGAAVTVLGSFLPWLNSGSVGRSSFELLGLIHRLGFVPNGAARTVVRAWPLMPLMLTAGAVGAWWGWRRIGAGLGAVGAAFAGSVGGLVAFAAPDTRGVELSDAPLLTTVGAGIVLLGSLLVLVVRVPSADANP